MEGGRSVKNREDAFFFEKAVNKVVFNEKILYTIYQRFSVYRIALRLRPGLYTNPFI